MKLIYAPKDGPREEWAFSEDDLTIGEVKLLEKVHGLPFGDISELLGRGSMTAIASLIWLMRKRSEPAMQLTDLDDIKLGDISNEADEAEGEAAPKEPVSDGSPVSPTSS